MLILPAEEKERQHKESVENLVGHFNNDLEKILNDNSDVDVYWILGKAKTEVFANKKVVRPFLQACLEKPGLVRESFVYEVDNRRGTKTLLWVMYPQDVLYFPTLKKSIRVTAASGGLISPPEIGRLTGV